MEGRGGNENPPLYAPNPYFWIYARDTGVTGPGAGTAGTVSLTLNGRNAMSDRQLIPGDILTQNGTALLGRSAAVDFLVTTDGKSTFMLYCSNVHSRLNCFKLTTFNYFYTVSVYSLYHFYCTP